MQSKRKRILTMLENGTITTEEALTLLENLSESKPEDNQETSQQAVEQDAGEMQSTQQDTTDEGKKTETDADTTQEEDPAGQSSKKETASEKSSKDEPSVDEFLEDLRKDFTHVSDRFMQFMQTAVHKVRSFDFESPFGQSTTFNHTLTKPADGIEEIIMDIDNGKITIHHGAEEEMRAEFSVKAYNSESEETAKQDFLDKVLFIVDEDKLRVSSNMKMTQVNIDLYVPKRQYKKISSRLMNGSFKIKGAKVETVRVKTANGKIDVSELKFNDAEFETANGAIRLNKIEGKTVSAETLNGHVYIDGDLKEVEAQSLNGHVVVTTSNKKAEKIDAKTMSGSVEIYIPSNIALSGEIASNMGRLDLQLADVDQTNEQEQLLQRTIRFKKDMSDSTSSLHIFGEAKTGSVLVCYNASSE